MDKQKRVLVVDDDEQILIVWRGALEGHATQWHVETARSGREALEKIRKTAFNLIITDLRMPGMDGCELTVAVRQLVGDISVIWVTAYPQAGILDRASSLAVHRLLNKPLTVAQMRQIVAEALEGTN